ncbi:MAG: putative hemolysin [Akkermansiaceae bacterium]|jgi:putative hemolysin
MSSKKPAAQFADVRTHVPFLAKHEGLARGLEELLCYPEIRRAFMESAAEKDPMVGVARRLGLKYRLEGLAEKIPSTGPVVVVCNHSHGGADAMALMAAMTDLRPDFKALANRETTLLEGLSPFVFPVSILDSEKAGENVSSIRAMLKHVRQGGALGLFPAGRVAYWQGDRMRDPAWNEQVVKLLQRMNATVVPLWFFGNPPPLINLLSRFSSFARMALIPTGLMKMAGREIVARVGEPFDGRDLKEMGEEAGTWLRRHLETLREKGN